MLTHEVDNQSVPFEDVNLFDTDVALQEALEREGAGWAIDRARDAGYLILPATRTLARTRYEYS